ncbi:von Willebrand factor A domain-containing protein 1-like [Tachysurus vachellii]|uniref:von Willebrand factor A domain-containing protein 1-like n=1 Tax=Tachysurus vachellii TaxID=175792 RepID=UPI00296A9A25|nr:von Willebrand factor A domain-containing protein 1-like [Tachysurus vachellii]
MTSVKVSWGPLQPESIKTYQVEYSTLPTGKLHVLTVNNRQDLTVLTNLQPGTQYLVTVSASYFSGEEKAMSIKEGLRGYWLTWEGESVQSSRQRFLYLPPHLLSTTLTHVPHNARVCVSLVYKSARGEGLRLTMDVYFALHILKYGIRHRSDLLSPCGLSDISMLLHTVHPIISSYLMSWCDVRLLKSLL